MELLLIVIITLLYCTRLSFAVNNHDGFPGLYSARDNVLVTKEELTVDGFEADSFTGGKGVERWIVLKSNHFTNLIGIKRSGLSLVTVTKQIGGLFQAVEKQIDLGITVTSAVAFNHFNQVDQRLEGIVAVSTESSKHDILWFKIRNYKLVRLWSWIRYTGVLSLHHFKISQEDILLVLEEGGRTAYLYRLSFETQAPKIRELEVLQFSKKVLSISISSELPEPFLFSVHKDEVGVHRYKRLCPEAGPRGGEFVRQPSLDYQGISRVYRTSLAPTGAECLLLAGQESVVLRVDSSGRIHQQLRIANIVDWIIMKTGPRKEVVLLLGKTLHGEILVFSYVGQSWHQLPAPPCVKREKDSTLKKVTFPESGCLRSRSWEGVVSLDVGDQPALVFSAGEHPAEMFHVLIKMTQNIFPLYGIPPHEPENGYSNILMNVRSNIEDIVSEVGRGRDADRSCSIVDMLTSIQQIAADAKNKLAESCTSIASNTHEEERPRPSRTHSKTSSASTLVHQRSYDTDNGTFPSPEKLTESDLVEKTKFPSLSISPDLEVSSPYQITHDMSGHHTYGGFHKQQENIVG